MAMHTDGGARFGSVRTLMQKRSSRRLAHLAALLLCTGFLLRAQDTTRVNGEEVDITVTVQQHGSTVLPSVLVGEDVYLPVFDLFQFLRIRTQVSVSGDTLTGFFILESASYTIDFATGRIRIGDSEHLLARSDYVRTEMAVFLRRAVFADVFGLECSFDFRALLVDVRSNLDLPLVREMQRERIRKSARRSGGRRAGDRQLAADRALFRPGVIDWSVSSRTPVRSRREWEASVAGGVGLLGGDAEVVAVSRSGAPLALKDLQWQWRYVDNTTPLLRQMSIGRFAASDADGRPATALGLSLSNTPTTTRNAFGAYVLDGYTGTEWTVELYQNQVIVDVAKADAQGYYRFEVPLSYGTTTLTLKFFGPWGEERSQERVVNIPFTFLPAGEFEYAISAGRIDGNADEYTGALKVNIGTGRQLTLGAGTDYWHASGRGRLAPFVSGSYRPLDELLLNAEYMHGTRMTALLSWTLPGRTALSVDWTRYDDLISGSATPGSEVRRVSLSTPVSSSLLQGNVRALLRQEISYGHASYGFDGVLSGSLFGIRTNVGVLGERLEGESRRVIASLTLSLQMPFALILRPQADIDILRGAVVAARAGIERILGERGWLTASMGREFGAGAWTGQLGIRYELPFAQTALGISHDGALSAATQSARGSIALDAAHASVHPDARSWLRRGGITIVAFLDTNGNGICDADERRLPGLDVRSDGGRILTEAADSLIRIVDLEAYRSYRIEVSPVTFENIAWQTRERSFDVEVLPNQFITLFVPVTVAGEVTGRITVDSTLSRRVAGGYTVRFIDAEKRLAGSTATEKDGSYYFLGLAPGVYTIEIDPAQLSRLGLRCEPRSISIRASEEGDIVTGADLRLEKDAAK